MSDKMPSSTKAASGHLPKASKFVGKTISALLEEEDIPVGETGAKAFRNPYQHPAEIRYILTVYRDDEPAYSVALPSQPTSKRYAHRPAAEVRYTLDEMPIREHSTGRAWGIQFTGMVGFNIRRSSRFDGRIGRFAGIEALLEFDKFVLSYHKLAEQEGSLYLGAATHRPMLDRTYLVLADFDEGISYRVEMEGWDWDRGPRTRVGNAEWRLSLHAYSPQQVVQYTWKRKYTNRGRTNLQGGRALDVGLEVLSTVDRIRARAEANEALWAASFMQDFEDGVAAGVPVSQMSGELAKAVSGLSGDPIPSGLAARLLAAAQTWTAKLQAAQEFGGDVAREYYDSVPRQAVVEVIVAGEAFVRTVQALKNSWSGIMQDPTSLFGRVQLAYLAVQRITDACYASLASTHTFLTEVVDSTVLGVTGNFGSIPNVQGAKPLPERGLSDVTAYTTKPGDSWASVALWYYGNADVWQTVAAFNGASTAYKGAGGTPLMPGTQVFLPGGGAKGSTAESSGDPDALYGTDLFIDLQTGDLLLADEDTIVFAGGAYTTTSSQGRDVLLVKGNDNLVHSLSHQLLTVRGEVLAVPEYGVMPLEPGDPLTEDNYAGVIVGVVDGISRDARVLQVDQVRPIIDQDKVSLSLRVRPVHGTVVGVVVPIGG